MRKFIFLFLEFLLCQITYAQGFRVKEFTVLLSDLSASTQLRTDVNDEPCGLVKVQTKVQGVEFDGAVGAVENKTNEYWVYLPKGTTNFTMRRPDYMPMTIELAEYGLDVISAKTTYLLTLKEINLNPEKCGLTIHVFPREAEVWIDDVLLKHSSSGDYKVLLPKGEYLCHTRTQGYKSNMQIVKTGKGIQDLNVEMESIMADVNIVSQTTTAEIFVNGESKGLGAWKGKLPPSNYVIEAQQEGHITVSHRITLAEKERRTITIPQLKKIEGSVNIRTTPKGCTVYLDGGEIEEKTPCVIKNIPYGNHELTIKIDSCGLQREKVLEVQIKNTNTQTLECFLASNEEIAYHKKAKDLLLKDGGSCYSCYYCGMDLYNNPGPVKEIEEIFAMIDKLDASFFTQTFLHYMGQMHEESVSYGYSIFSYYNFFEKYDKCVKILRKVGDAIVYKMHWSQAEEIARVYEAVGDYVHAIEYYKKELAIAKQENLEGYNIMAIEQKIKELQNK